MPPARLERATYGSGELEETFRGFGYVFRQYTGAKFEFLEWQAGRIAEFPDALRLMGHCD